MNFNDYPRDYQSVFAPNEVSVYGCDPAQPTDIELIECFRGDTLGVRRLYGQERYAFSPTGYLRHTIAHAPMVPYQSPWILQAGLRTLKLKVRMGLFESPVTLLTAARERIEPGTLLSAMPSPKRLPRDGFDELSLILKEANLYAIFRFYGPDGLEARVDSPSIDVGHEMAVLYFGLPAMAPALARQGHGIEQFDRLEVSVYANDELRFVQHYLLEEADPEAIAIGWVNERGGLDVYHLFHERKRSLTLQAAIGTGPGDYHTLHGLQTDTLVELTSHYEPRATLEWLSGILRAPKVWLLDQNTAREVVVTSSQATLRDEQPSRLTLECKIAAPIPFQNLN